VSEDEAITSLESMFAPGQFDKEVLKSVLHANNGHVDKTVECLLQMSDPSTSNTQPSGQAAAADVDKDAAIALQMSHDEELAFELQQSEYAGKQQQQQQKKSSSQPKAPEGPGAAEEIAKAISSVGGAVSNTFKKLLSSSSSNAPVAASATESSGADESESLLPRREKGKQPDENGGEELKTFNA